MSKVRIQVLITEELKEEAVKKAAEDVQYSSLSHLGEVAITQLLCEHHIVGDKCLKCKRRF